MAQLRAAVPADEAAEKRAQPARSAAASDALGAAAYTGPPREIPFAAPREQTLPHEAWHVVQQAQGRVRPPQE